MSSTASDAVNAIGALRGGVAVGRGHPSRRAVIGRIGSASLFLPILRPRWASAARQPAIVKANGIDIAYRVFGPQAAPPILVIQGVGGEMPQQPDDFLEPLVAAGHRVIVFDNRDSGGSTHLSRVAMPTRDATAPQPYTLEDMAMDTLGLLDALGVKQAHIVGGSAGGMIAQILAAEHAGRVASLTLLSSTTNNPALPTGMDAQAFGNSFGSLPPNLMRQGLAASMAGDMRPRDARITAATVVVHGAQDEVFPLAHGRDLAASIPNARLVIIDGMGHVPDATHSAQIANAIQDVMARSRAARQPGR